MPLAVEKISPPGTMTAVVVRGGAKVVVVVVGDVVAVVLPLNTNGAGLPNELKLMALSIPVQSCEANPLVFGTAPKVLSIQATT